MITDKDLKAIWKSDDTPPAATIDLESIKLKALNSDERVRRKIKWDIGLNIAAYVLFAPVAIAYPRVLATLPIIVAVWLWYLREILRIYRAETDFGRFADARELLKSKLTMIRGFLRRTRIIALMLVPTIYGLSLWVYDSLDLILASPLYIILGFFAFAIPVVGFVELYIRYFYSAELDELTDLLQQLDDASATE